MSLSELENNMTNFDSIKTATRNFMQANQQYNRINVQIGDALVNTTMTQSMKRATIAGLKGKRKQYDDRVLPTAYRSLMSHVG